MRNSNGRPWDRGTGFFLAALLFCALAPRGAAAVEGKRALLIGCTKYPQLPQRLWLNGPVNDVKLLRTVLIERFGFEAKNIAVLSGWDESPPAARPTRANIEQAFRQLEKDANPGDQIVILLAGHGAQQPLPPKDDGGDPANREPDGLDEIFLPADVVGWNGGTQTVANAILDNQIGAWLDAICAKSARAWIIFDACHSGTMTRGEPNSLERDRHVEPADLGIPADALATAEKRARAASAGERTRGGENAGALADSAEKKANFTALYAALPSDLTPELPLPRELGDKGECHGLLTWITCKTLQECAAPLTYRELGQRIIERYRSWPRNWPTPFVDGDVDREVLGLKQWPQRSLLRLARRAGKLQVTAGEIHGLTAGSILAVYPPAGGKDADQTLGYVRATTVGPLLSDVTPAEHNKTAAIEAAKLPDNARCEVVAYSFGETQLKVAFVNRTLSPGQTARGARPAPPGPPPAAWTEAAAQLEKEAAGMVKIVARAEEADWLARCDGPRAVLEPAEGEIVRIGGGAPTGQVVPRGPFSTQEMSKMADELKRIYRWKNLVRIAAQREWPAQTSDAPADLKMEILRLKDANDLTGQPIAQDDTLRENDRIIIRLTNTGRTPLDVTLLALDADFGITCLYPDLEVGDSTNRLLAGGVPQHIGPIRVTGKAAGREYLAAIAVPNAGAPADFAFLGQASLADARRSEATRGRGDAALESPLSKLLLHAAFGGRTRDGSPFEREPRQPWPVFRLFTCQTARAPAADHVDAPAPVQLAANVSQEKDAPPRLPDRFGKNKKLLLTPEALNAALTEPAPEPWQGAANLEKLRGGTELYAKVAPAVVAVRTDFGHGTGFFVSEDGLLLTNFHVISAGTRLNADRQASTAVIHFGRLSPAGVMELAAEPLIAEILGVDPTRDLALLKLAQMPPGMKTVPFLTFAAEPPRPGQNCAIIGHPSSGMLWTYRSGEVASVGQMPRDMIDMVMHRLAATGAERKFFEETLARLESRTIILSSCEANPGDSGGPVANERGELIAVTFAIPNDPAKAKFTYHVHWSEVRKFLETHKATNTPLVLLPDPWRLGLSLELRDLLEEGRAQALISGGRRPEQILLDLDGDTPAPLLEANDFEKLAKERRFEAEWALRRDGLGKTVFYDTDNDGTFDLILIARADALVADEAFERDADGKWSQQRNVRKPLVDEKYFKDEKLGQRLRRLLERL